MVISEARLKGRSKGLIWGIVGVSAIVIAVSALVSGILFSGLIISAGIVAVTWTIVRMTVSITISEEKIVLRLAPFYSTEMSISDIVAVAAVPETTLADGYGFRIAGKYTRGLLLGGPAVALQTKARRWIVSTAHPEEVMSAIRARMTTK